MGRWDTHGHRIEGRKNDECRLGNRDNSGTVLNPTSSCKPCFCYCLAVPAQEREGHINGALGYT